MQRKNGEASKCANTNEASSVSNLKRVTDMKSIANSELNFHGTALIPVTDVNGIWLTSADVAKALGYKSTKSISNLFAQYEDEFSQGMTMVIESVTNGINGSSRRMKVRVFSLRGAHLIAMFARTPVAKEFRRWVLDILDREVANSPIVKQFTDEELCTLCWLWRNAVSMISNSADVYPILRAAEHRLAGSVYSAAHEYPRNTNKVRALLERETAHIKAGPFTDDNWRVLNRLRVGQLLN
ncbi:P22AR C-terminal domain-containing protein [Yersinia frederiksenii]|uniref:P22AR C-terminal domain-containing protein n=1 Tax=Yersinia frederiksenii TaxID=29484 RepID=UPI0005E7A3A7|nr:P22AR C-terminal domain-containing protein [Yersinia frederiksenii]CNL08605.1 phage antirepressor [Yersinia frederiksenii]